LALMGTGGYGVGGFEIWRLWVPPERNTRHFNLNLVNTIKLRRRFSEIVRSLVPRSALLAEMRWKTTPLKLTVYKLLPFRHFLS